MTALDGFLSPPGEFSPAPFWFWNDDLDAREILRQIADFQSHGVHGFVIHPRVGLPRRLGWMSEALLGFMEIAVAEARRRGMKVILYDEGMYPSGSSGGQVVARNPELACRCLALADADMGVAVVAPPPGANVVAELPRRGDGRRLLVVDRKADSYVRGLHYQNEDESPTPREDEPPAGDILNPLTASAVLDLVYEPFARRLGRYFGDTVVGVFTDEPHPLGKCREPGVRPGTTGILAHVNAVLGYDFTPHLAALWFDDDPDAVRRRRDYHRAVQRRLEETWYRPLSEWCASHGVALCGHPAAGDEIGVQRFFHVPGQDLVWRVVEPDKPSAVEGPESTQAKCTASAMLHAGRRRNSNEFCGAYGPATTYDEFKWLADWCLVRGVNWLIPHAFYYSVRGPRRGERPPQVGPHGPWWDRFKPFADHCRRLSWLNTDSTHACDAAILTGPDHCPWGAAKVCFEHQRNFNYLELRLLEAGAEVTPDGVRIAGMRYGVLIIDGLDDWPADVEKKCRPLLLAGRVVRWSGGLKADGLLEADTPEAMVRCIDRVSPADVRVTPPAPALRTATSSKPATTSTFSSTKATARWTRR